MQHLKILRDEAKSVRHLLPAGMTSESQLVDHGIGYAVKHEMGYRLDRWLEKESNISKWCGDTYSGGLFMWQKLVLVSQQ